MTPSETQTHIRSYTIDSTPRRNGSKYDITLWQAMALELLLCIKACNRWCIFSISMNLWLQLPCEWGETVVRWRERDSVSDRFASYIIPCKDFIVLLLLLCATMRFHIKCTHNVCKAKSPRFVSHICNRFDCRTLIFLRCVCRIENIYISIEV